MIRIRNQGMLTYQNAWEAMKGFTQSRSEHTMDEAWFLEHFPVYTQGQAGKAEHILNPGGIPVVQSDRGGQVTYHGPGQLIVYFLVDLRRRNIGIRTFVHQLEQMVIALLEEYHISANTQCGAPGVYVDEKKIASIGLRVKNGCTYHGIALNVAMDLQPFAGINPCGFERLKMTQIQDYVPDITVERVQNSLHQQCMIFGGL
ncbi:MAG: lipoyl(octanoyl) transferase LipB [Legionellaceae bacterium]|nr:lipoyl(octanoyl) transferase LipB [Legionellaceae bacterium]